ncbi:MAG: SDR family NAD(P)-dependent oxidoreductase [Propionibacteriales bacterium]|nr:SDR family NAD(P)-dependent oxidoreductase [Propionibacteriales bacterium]
MNEQDPQDRTAALLRRATTELRAARRRVQQLESDPVAVVAMACRLPAGVDTPEKLWDLLEAGEETLSHFPEDRGWDLEGLFHPDPDHPGTSYVDQAGFLDDAAGFDPELFGIAPREAEAMDPQHRILLETCWELFERAGMDPLGLRGSSTGVFVGAAKFGYGEGVFGDPDGYAVTGTAPSVASGRLSYTFGLEGPSLTVDTACSSSLVALHLALDSLRKGESRLAVVGGAAVMGSPDVFVDFSRQRALAADGRSKAFGAGADGFGFSEGVSLVLLERLSEAQRLGHPVLAVVRGSAVNQDGASNGLSAPSGRAQRRVLRAALERCGLEPDDVDVVEAHGTGTALGDPIEAGALLEVYGQDRARPLGLGSVKSNLGHTQAAAGVTGLLKLVLALQHERVPRTLHVDEPSTHIDWSSGSVRLLDRPLPWPRSERPRRAGLSAIGISGTNAHVIVEEAPAPDAAAPVSQASPAPVLLPLSARTSEALAQQARRVADLLRSQTIDLADLAVSLGTTRAHLEQRAVVVAETSESALDALERLALDDPEADIVRGAAEAGGRTTAFVFPGQGSQWVAMGLELMSTSPLFVEVVDACDEAMRPWQDWSVADVLRQDPDSPGLDRVDVVQPVLFTVMVALARLWRRHGVEPAAVVGHSQGEIAAAHVAGILTLEDAARLVVLRSQALRRLSARGGMVAVACSEAEARERIGPWEPALAVAAVNGPRSVVVSGDRDALEALVASCEEDGVQARTIDVDYASHSPHVDEVREEVLERARGVLPQDGETPFYSTVTAGPLAGSELGAAYWFRNLRECVRLHETVDLMADQGYDAFIEVSPHPVLLPAVTETVEARSGGEDGVVLPTLRRGEGGLTGFSRALAAAYVAGIEIGWRAVAPGATARALPTTYPFQRRRFWRAERRPHARAGRLFHRVDWSELDPTDEGPVPAGTWLVVVPEESVHGWSPVVVEAIRRAGGDAQVVTLAEVAAAGGGLVDAPDRWVGTVVLPPSAEQDPVSAAEAARSTVQALARVGGGAPVWLLTSGAVSTAPGEAPARPEQATLHGLGHVARLELGGRWGGVVDLPATVSTDVVAPLTEAWSRRRESVMAIRGRRLLGRRLRADGVRRVERWRPRGTVLVSGAATPVGAVLARWVARNGADRLLLAGRSPDARLLRELEEIGVEVSTSAVELAGLRDAIGEDELTAVVHAESDPVFAPVVDADADGFQRTVEARSALPDLLDDLLDGRRLEREVLCSSVAATWGGAGMAAYAAGAAYLEATAARRRSEGHHTSVVTWTPWDLPAGHDAAPDLTGSGLRPLSESRALEAWEAVLDAAPSDVVVADADWPALADEFSAARPTALFDGLVEAPAPSPTVTAAPSQDSEAPGTGSVELQAIVALGAQDRRDGVRALVAEVAADVLGQDDASRVSRTRALREQGLDSLGTLALRKKLAARTGLPLAASLVYDHPSVSAIADHLLSTVDPVDRADDEGPAGRLASDEPIAIVGVGCRFPGGIQSPEALWDLLRAGDDVIGSFPEDRGWEVGALYDPEGVRPGTSYVDRGGFLDDVASFDPGFFGITPREALAMDPQQRLVLETSWEAMERAGIDPETVRGSDVGVYLGMNGQSYADLLDGEGDRVDGYKGLGNAASVLSGRVAYTFGWVGPALTVDTACSASLVAVHLAVRALRSGECSMALAGGVTVMTDPYTFVDFSSQQGLARDGRCKAFSVDADGFALADGVATMLLVPLSRAQELDLPVLGLVRGSAVNQDGASNGLAAPNGPSQERVIRAALADAGLAPQDVDVVEAHGTGTQLGDPIEAGALLSTYGRDADSPVHLGSVKSNLGHTQAAAGAAGMLKVLLALRHGVVPRTLHADEPTPHVDWASGGLRLAQDDVPWPRGERPRRAGVSSFGVSGTNAHVVLEEAPDAGTVDRPVPDAARAVPLVLSGRSEGAVRSAAHQLAARLADGTHDVRDVAWTLSRGRSAMEWRAAVPADDVRTAVTALEALADGSPTADVIGPALSRPRRAVLVFPGQGSQWDGMARDLLATSTVFRQSMQECAQALSAHVTWDLLDVVEGRGDVDAERVDVLQPVLFSMMVSLARTWREHGLVPAAVVGHSQGEIAAACVAGALSLDEAARVVAVRSRALREIDGDGGMVSVAVPVDEAERLLAPWADQLAVAAVNGPRMVVVAGPVEQLDAFCAAVERAGLEPRRVSVGYGSHSGEVERVRKQVLDALGDVQVRTSEVPVYSTVTAERIDSASMDAGYWYDNLRGRVRFTETVEALVRDGHDLFVEASPHPVLLGGVQDVADDLGADVDVVATLRRDRPGARELARATGEAFVHGASVEPATTVPDGRFVDLPTYPFQRERFWPRRRSPVPVTDSGLPGVDHPVLSTVVEVPGSGERVLVGRLDPQAHPWLAEHVVEGRHLVPGSVLVELALAAGELVGLPVLEELLLQEPLELPAAGGLRLRLVVGPVDDGRCDLHVHAAPDGTQDPTWTLQASGVLGADATASGPTSDGSAWPPADAVAIELDGHYDTLVGLGFEYGPSFQGLRRAWRAGERVLAEVEVPAARHGFVVDPVVLDVVAQTLGVAAAESGRLPFAWNGVQVRGPVVGPLRVVLGGDPRSNASLEVVTPAGATVLTVDGIVVRDAAAGTDLRSGTLQSMTWVPAQPDGPAAAVTTVEVATLDELDASGRPDADLVVIRHVDDDPDSITATRRAVTWAADVVRRWGAADRGRARLGVVTDGGACVGAGDPPPRPGPAAVWGVLRAAQAESPDRFLLVDGALGAPERPDLPQVAVRDGVPLVPRLGDRPASLVPGVGQRVAPGSGSIDGLVLETIPAAQLQPGPGEVRVAVRATGLNFRDVMLALRVYPDAALMGTEAAGVVEAVGEGVTSVKVGDRVLGLFAGAYAEHAVTDARLVAPLPPDWSFAQGAAVPIAFTTAYYALHDLADVQQGQTVLVHAAAGGVGMAAVSLARHAGADVLATASPAKHDAVQARGLPADRVRSSRTSGFADAFLDHTRGRGVDVVLNSLTGPLLDETIRLVAPDGVVVELGKADLRDPADVAARYLPFDLGEVGPDRLGEILRTVVGLLAGGQVQLVPVSVRPLASLRAALTEMSRGGHVGKLVVEQSRPSALEGTVLVVGGTGTLGSLVARHLVSSHGVRHLLLISRRGPDAPGAADMVAELEAEGARVDVVACEATDRARLAEVVRGVPAERPLVGVVHAAGVLADSLVVSIDADAVETVVAPKVDVVQHLDELTADLDLDLFVVFSSAASVLAGPGQGVYAAANAVVEACVARRASRGARATALGWGLWQDSSDLTRGLEDQIAGTGVAPLSRARALELLDEALGTDEPVLYPMALDLDALAEADVVPEVLRDRVEPTRGRREAEPDRDERGTDWASRLGGLDADARRTEVLDLVRTHAAAVAGFSSAAQLPEQRAFRDLGFDSLAAVELRNRLRDVTSVRLPSTLVFDYPTAEAVAERLLEDLEPVVEHDASSLEEQLAALERAVRDAAPDQLPADLGSRVRGLLDVLPAGEVEGRARDGGAAAAALVDDDTSDDELFSLLDARLGAEGDQDR